MQRNIKVTVEYDGTYFKGWQVQAKNARTVQGEIEKVLKKIFKTKIRLIGSGRTDSGVHAKAQVANFKIKSTISTKELSKALNANLPDDIVVLKVAQVKSNFHAQYSAKAKTYQYTILNQELRSAKDRFTSLYYPHTLNLRKMREEAKALLGKHDFKSFQAKDPSKKREDTIRTIKRLDIKKKGDHILITIEANGFLYKMVRNIVGTLLEVGRSKFPKGAMKEILKAKNRSYAGYTAKPQGLALMEVKY